MNAHHILLSNPLDSQCNNPMTKEPKLQAAVRIVPEWTSYDEEIKQLMQEVQGNLNNMFLHHTAGLVLLCVCQ